MKHSAVLKALVYNVQRKRLELVFYLLNRTLVSFPQFVSRFKSPSSHRRSYISNKLRPILRERLILRRRNKQPRNPRTRNLIHKTLLRIRIPTKAINDNRTLTRLVFRYIIDRGCGFEMRVAIFPNVDRIDEREIPTIAEDSGVEIYMSSSRE